MKNLEKIVEKWECAAAGYCSLDSCDRCITQIKKFIDVIYRTAVEDCLKCLPKINNKEISPIDDMQSDTDNRIIGFNQAIYQSQE